MYDVCAGVCYPSVTAVVDRHANGDRLDFIDCSRAASAACCCATVTDV